MEVQRALERGRGAEFSASTDAPLGSEADAQKGFHSKVYELWAQGEKAARLDAPSGQGSSSQISNPAEGGFQ